MEENCGLRFRFYGSASVTQDRFEIRMGLRLSREGIVSGYWLIINQSCEGFLDCIYEIIYIRFF